MTVAHLHYGFGLAAGDGTRLRAPATDGTNQQAMVTDGNGQLSFASISASPGGVSGDIQFNDGGSFGGFGDWDGAALTLDGVLQVEGPRQDNEAAIPVKLSRNSSLTSTFVSSFVGLATTDGNMVDGFGVRYQFRIMDDAGVENLIGSIGFARHGADNSGRFRIDPQLLGSTIEAFSVTGEATEVGSLDAARDSTLSILTDADFKSRLKLRETTDNFGFTVQYTGGSNTFQILRHDNSSAGVSVLSIDRATGDMSLAESIAIFGSTPPTSQPATPVDLADVIALLQSYGMCQ